MHRLPAYLLRLFSIHTLALFGIMLFLVYITQTLRLFDLVTVKGQDIWTLFSQAALTTPSLGQSILSICMALGLARALRELNASRELHVIHSSGRRRAIWTGLAAFVVIGTLVTAFSAHYVEPLSKKAYANWTAEVAADLVGRSLSPHKFTEIVPGLMVVIGGRSRDGTIRDFFAHDTRLAGDLRTYQAQSAVLQADDDGYQLQLISGSIQSLSAEGRFSEVVFNRYEISLERLSAADAGGSSIEQSGSMELMTLAGTAGEWPAAWHEIEVRLAETARVLALCLLAGALGVFPQSVRGGSKVPGEAIVLFLALADRTVSGFSAYTLPTGELTGPLMVLLLAVAILVWRLNRGAIPAMALPRFRRLAS